MFIYIHIYIYTCIHITVMRMYIYIYIHIHTSISIDTIQFPSGSYFFSIGRRRKTRWELFWGRVGTAAILGFPGHKMLAFERAGQGFRDGWNGDLSHHMDLAHAKFFFFLRNGFAGILHYWMFIHLDISCWGLRYHWNDGVWVTLPSYGHCEVAGERWFILPDFSSLQVAFISRIPRPFFQVQSSKLWETLGSCRLACLIGPLLAWIFWVLGPLYPSPKAQRMIFAYWPLTP